MATTAEIKAFKKEEVNTKDNFLDLSITRTDKEGKPLEDGVMLHLQSDIMEGWILANSKYPKITADSDKWEVSTAVGWKDHKAYPMSDVFKASELGKHFSHWGKALTIDGVGVNLSFLRARDLKTGIDIHIPGMVTETAIQKFLQDLRKELINVHKEYMKPLDLKLSILMGEVI